MKLVLDASVALKWFFGDRDGESDIAAATEILDRFVAGEITLVAPCHFQAEVCAVLAREAPEAMRRHLVRLIDLSIPVIDDALTIARAMRLAHELEHHLFDTLYHAVALEEDAMLVTADRRYLTKARERGGHRRPGDVEHAVTDSDAVEDRRRPPCVATDTFVPEAFR